MKSNNKLLQTQKIFYFKLLKKLQINKNKNNKGSTSIFIFQHHLYNRFGLLAMLPVYKVIFIFSEERNLFKFNTRKE